jgi:hypothetical protein
MEIGEGNEHLEAIHISLLISRQNEQNLKSTNIRSIIILIHIQNMNIKLNMKDINKILALAHFKSKYFFKLVPTSIGFLYRALIPVDGNDIAITLSVRQNKPICICKL